MILNREIENPANKIVICSGARVLEQDKVLQLVESEMKMEEVLHFYCKLVKLADCFVETFGFPFGAAWLMDVCVMLSLVVTAMLSAQDSEMASWMTVFADIFGIMGYATYIGLFTLPMISPSSKVQLRFQMFSECNKCILKGSSHRPSILVGAL